MLKSAINTVGGVIRSVAEGCWDVAKFGVNSCWDGLKGVTNGCYQGGKAVLNAGGGIIRNVSDDVITNVGEVSRHVGNYTVDTA
mmetsp:Transcript_20684/g.27916  ORF Transcript_20684/g.27916 Transcript_20684/m.27916 type:complete len:84 (+) Transcript_20684:187-438(+)